MDKESINLSEIIIGCKSEGCGDSGVFIPEWLPQYIYQKNRETGNTLFEK